MNKSDSTAAPVPKPVNGVWRQVPENALIINGEVIPVANAQMGNCRFLVLVFGADKDLAETIERLSRDVAAPPMRRIGKYTFQR